MSEEEDQANLKLIVGLVSGSIFLIGGLLFAYKSQNCFNYSLLALLGSSVIIWTTTSENAAATLEVLGGILLGVGAIAGIKTYLTGEDGSPAEEDNFKSADAGEGVCTAEPEDLTNDAAGNDGYQAADGNIEEGTVADTPGNDGYQAINGSILEGAVADAAGNDDYMAANGNIEEETVVDMELGNQHQTKSSVLVKMSEYLKPMILQAIKDDKKPEVFEYLLDLVRNHIEELVRTEKLAAMSEQLKNDAAELSDQSSDLSDDKSKQALEMICNILRD